MKTRQRKSPAIFSFTRKVSTKKYFLIMMLVVTLSGRNFLRQDVLVNPLGLEKTLFLLRYLQLEGFK